MGFEVNLNGENKFFEGFPFKEIVIDVTRESAEVDPVIRSNEPGKIRVIIDPSRSQHVRINLVKEVQVPQDMPEERIAETQSEVVEDAGEESAPEASEEVEEDAESTKEAEKPY